jgi:hypothetical protein
MCAVGRWRLRKLKAPIWIFRLRGGNKPHLAMSDVSSEASGPLKKTLCGKTYNPDERVKARTTGTLDGTECKACRLALLPLPSQAVYFTHPTPEAKRKVHLQRRGGGCLCGKGGPHTVTTTALNELTCERCLNEVLSATQD